MTDSTIEFSIGSLSFGGSGSEEWLSKQLDKIIEAAPELSQLKLPPKPQAAAAEQESATGGKVEEPFTASLASHIKSKGGETNQVKRFLATADWLRRRGTSPLSSGLIAKTLSEHHQKKLANPADCLGKNIARGFCEKDKDGFFITPGGLSDLGYKD